MPFHVILEVSGSPEPLVRTDLTAEELSTRFLEPYTEGTPLVVDGRTVSLQSLRRIKIYESEDPIARIIEAVEQSDDERLVLHLGDIRRRAVEISRDVTEQFVTKPPGHAGPLPGSAPVRLEPEPPRNSVFLVHGRNLAVNGALRDLLRAMGLQVVEWTQAVRQTGIPSPMTADIVDQGFAMSYATVILMTPDDLVRIHPDLSAGADDGGALLGQPRPNVLFEAGMAWALRRERTVIVEFDSLIWPRCDDAIWPHLLSGSVAVTI